MSSFHVCVLGGSCGNRMVIIADHLTELFRQKGYNCTVTSKSVWECFTFPPAADLLLQLLPAFSDEEMEYPSINIRPLLQNINDPGTLERIFSVIEREGSVSAIPAIEETGKV
ncbi:MAG TPA: hypothetical protein PLL88_09000 [Anaerolineaceae bacterium]|nr:hypothetical protein [Anaerolineaceae bacterium]